MTTEHYDPTRISMTQAANAHVKRQLQVAGADALVLRVTESGCNGYMYEMSYIAEDAAEGRTEGFEISDAHTFDFDDDVRVYVTQKDWDMVRGTEIDFVTEGLNSVLKFNNPNAETQCGCGESFSLRGT